MRTFNTYFTNYKELEEYIDEHSLIASNSLLIQIFSGILNINVLEELSSFLYKRLPQSKVIGSTTDGEILDNNVTTEKIVISFTSFEHSQIKISSSCEKLTSFNHGKVLAKDLLQKDTKIFILFASGLSINGEEFLNGVRDVAPNIVVAGGLSGDNTKFENNYLICNDEIYASGAVGISIQSKELYVHNNYALSWQTLGRAFKVNKSRENIVYEIDGMTPYELYKKYLGNEIASQLPGIGIEYPLIIERNNVEIARAIVGINDDGSLVFAGNIIEGSEVKFGIGNTKNLLNGSKHLAIDASKEYIESIFIYSCMARRRYLDSKAYLDVKYFSKLGNVSGFFTYGEFYSTQNEHELLNESLTLLSLSEHKVKPTTDDFNVPIIIDDELLRQNALSHIINTTAQELDTLNLDLEQKVIEKTEKNIEHEKYIYEQMKMVQMGEMIENIAHQWRQPLSAISSSASSILLQEELGILNSNDIKKYMETIINDTMFLSETIDTFRTFIKEKKEFKEVILQERINLALGIIATTLHDCNIDLVKNIHENKPIRISLIVGELSQVLLNILNNAKDIIIERKIIGGKITLSLEEKNNLAIIKIKDNAGGIPEKILSKIFDPYFTTKHQSKGTGIGLYMSHDIITNHLKGKLYVNNTKDGACFTIELPINV